MVTEEGRFLNEKFGDPNLGPSGLNYAQSEVFRHFIEFGSFVFLEIAYSDSLQHCLTSTRSKTYDTKIGDLKLWPKGTKIRPKIRFFAIYSTLVH